MTDPATSPGAESGGDRDSASVHDAPGPAAPPGVEAGEWDDYEGPGAWGAWAIGLLLFLFVVGVVATIHSAVVTLGG